MRSGLPVNRSNGAACRVADHSSGSEAADARGEGQNRGERPPRAGLPPAQLAEAVVLALRCRLTMIARHERNRLDLVRLEAAQVAVLDEVVRVLVVPLVADVDADVVQNRGVFEPV